MEGRWTIRWQPFTQYVSGGYKVGGREPWPVEYPTPVVPCDDAAIERATDAVQEITGFRARKFPREIAEAVLRAAGESGPDPSKCRPPQHAGTEAAGLPNPNPEEHWRKVVAAAYDLVARDEGRSDHEILQQLREDLHDALGGES